VGGVEAAARRCTPPALRSAADQPEGENVCTSVRRKAASRLFLVFLVQTNGSERARPRWQLLLAAGAQPNRFDQNGGTPLHDAAWEGHASTVELLLQAGAVPSCLNAVRAPLHAPRPQPRPLVQV
jgi:ankyrin repeat protein